MTNIRHIEVYIGMMKRQEPHTISHGTN